MECVNTELQFEAIGLESGMLEVIRRCLGDVMDCNLYFAPENCR